MGLYRHSAIDAYTLEELKRQYQCSDPQGRIRFLRKLYKDMGKIPYEMRRHHKDGIIPYEIALMAVRDEAVEV